MHDMIAILPQFNVSAIIKLDKKGGIIWLNDIEQKKVRIESIFAGLREKALKVKSVLMFGVAVSKCN